MSSEQIAIDSGGEVRLPVVEVLTGRAFLTGKSGAGKSNSASVVAEELLDRGFPLLIIDTDGEYWGLKEESEIIAQGDREWRIHISDRSVKITELTDEHPPKSGDVHTIRVRRAP
jgi:CO dehydrogenase nickel-insertion accessory protein CooC1